MNVLTTTTFLKIIHLPEWNWKTSLGDVAMIWSFIFRIIKISFFFGLDNPGISPDDPKWIGAWWLGFVVIAIAFGAGALIIVFFPKQLNNEVSDDLSTVSETVQDISNNNKKESANVKGMLKCNVIFGQFRI